MRCLILSPLNNPPTPVCKRLPSRWPLVCQLVVVSPLLSRRRRLSSFQHAASTSCPLDTQPALQRAASTLRHATASCLLAPLLSFASLLTVGSHISSRRAAASSAHPRPPPSFTLGLVVASHLIALLPPTSLSSTPPPLDALATHLPSRLPLGCPNWLPVCLTWYAL
jgi:hypothetical protein